MNIIFDYYHGKDKVDKSIYPGLIFTLEKLISRSTTMRNPLSSQVQEEEAEIFNLTSQQYSLLNFLSRNRKAAIGGCAGSGKTLLAMEKAKRLANEGFRTLLTCYKQGFLQTIWFLWQERYPTSQ